MLFGHQTDNSQQSVTETSLAMSGTNPLATDHVTGASLPATANDNTPVTVSPSQQFGQDIGQATSSFDNPLADETSQTAPELSQPQPAPTPVEPPAQSPAVSSDDLLSLKQQALGQLTPLVNHLEQTPEERFRTTMMMIQSTDNQTLIKDAYDAAQAITDDKTRAQALLDVINEINYFTQQKQN